MLIGRSVRSSTRIEQTETQPSRLKLYALQFPRRAMNKGAGMREKLEDAAVDCRSVTFSGACEQVEQIRRLARRAAKDFRRQAFVEVQLSDVVVTFRMPCE